MDAFKIVAMIEHRGQLLIATATDIFTVKDGGLIPVRFQGGARAARLELMEKEPTPR